jgi:uncharacterized membrane protein
MSVSVENGKFTFIQESYLVHILRHGEPWVRDVIGSNAVSSMMAELDAARVVLEAARLDVRDGLATQCLQDALKRHESLVSDHLSPSAWTK